jgi:hypothetical protein
MKERFTGAGITTLILTGSIIYAVQHPEAIRKQAEVLITNRVAVIPKPQDIPTITVLDIRKI